MPCDARSWIERGTLCLSARSRDGAVSACPHLAREQRTISSTLAGLPGVDTTCHASRRRCRGSGTGEKTTTASVSSTTSAKCTARAYLPTIRRGTVSLPEGLVAALDAQRRLAQPSAA